MNLPDQKLTAFLSFSGCAEHAMRFYEDVLPGARIESITRFKPGQPNGDAGKVLNGLLDIGGQQLMFMDMPATHSVPPFAWSVSLLLSYAQEAEFDTAFTGLSAAGMVMMGPEPVLDMRKCAWVTDQYGVTWQLVWA